MRRITNSSYTAADGFEENHTQSKQQSFTHSRNAFSMEYEAERNLNVGYGNSGPETSQRVTDHNEFRRMSSSNSESESAFKNLSSSANYQASGFISENYPVNVKPAFPCETGYRHKIQIPNQPQFYGDGLRSASSTTSHFPTPFPVFNPSEPPPTLAPFFRMPPPGIRPASFPPQQKLDTVLPQNTVRTILPPKWIPPPNTFGAPLPLSGTFGSSSFGPASLQDKLGTTSSGTLGNVSSQSNIVLPQAASMSFSYVQPSQFSAAVYPVGPASFFVPPPSHRSSLDSTTSSEGKVVSGGIETGMQQEINDWLKKTGKLKSDGTETYQTSQKIGNKDELVAGRKKQICISEVHKRLRSVLHALAAVQGELQNLVENWETVDSESWDSSVMKIRQLQEAYKKVKKEIDVDQLQQVKEKCEHRRKKRERQKRQKLEEQEAEQQVLFERAKKHAAIHQWQDQILQAHLNQQQVKQMKETADKTLGKVRREIREARKMLDTVHRLQKLRAVRNDTAEKRGQTFAPSLAEDFSDKTNNLIELLNQQIESREQEEAALKLILETEKEEAQEREKEEKQLKEMEMKQSAMEAEKICLFGLPAWANPSDSLQPFIDYYQQAQYSLLALQRIRQEWDTFLVPENTPLASRIPDGWVDPEPPSSPVWASVLQPESS